MAIIYIFSALKSRSSFNITNGYVEFSYGVAWHWLMVKQRTKKNDGGFVP